MKKAFINIGLACTLAIITTISISACGTRPTSLQTNTALLPQTTTTPDYSTPDYTQSDYSATMDNSYSQQNQMNMMGTSVPNVQVGTFKVDQDLVNQWQVRGIAVASGSIYLTVVDASGLFKKGTVVKMDSASGKSWKEIGATMLGLKHPISENVQGITVFGGNIIAIEQSKIYTLDSSTTSSVKAVEGVGGVDIASGGGAVYVTNGSSVDKTDSSVSNRAPIVGMTSSGGIGVDSFGAVYAISGTSIKKADATGQATDVVTGITGGLDVAVDSRNGDIYILEASMVKRYDANGQILSQFATQATKPVGIAVDEQGAVYVADSGSDYKDSKVIKFSAADVDSSSMLSSMNTGSTGYGSTYGSGTSTYGSTGYGSTYGSGTSHLWLWNIYLWKRY